MDRKARALCGILLAALIGLSFLSRRGFTRTAAAGYLAALWLFVTTALALFGTWRTPAASAYAVLALAAALLFGTRGARRWARSSPPPASPSRSPTRGAGCRTRGRRGRGSP